MAADWVVDLKERASTGGADYVVQRRDGDVVVTVAMDPFQAGELTAYEVDFAWVEGKSCAPFVFDICLYEDLSPASSSPSDGWVSWLYLPRLALAHANVETEQSDAKVVEVEDLTFGDVHDPTDDEWAAIARAITRELMS